MASITRRTGIRGNDKRNAVEDKLEAALQRLIDAGESFTQVSVEQLAKEAGIARATFYLHFRDKGELVTRRMAQAAEEVIAAARVDAPETITQEGVKKVIRAVAKVYRLHYAVLTAAAETAVYDEAVREHYDELMQRLIDVNRRTLQRLIKARRLPAGTPPLIADTLTWAFERSCRQLLYHCKPAQFNALVDALTLMTWNSLYTPSQA